MRVYEDLINSEKTKSPKEVYESIKSESGTSTVLSIKFAGFLD